MQIHPECQEEYWGRRSQIWRTSLYGWDEVLIYL